MSHEYRTIVVDPPWHQERGPEFIAPDRRQANPKVRTRETNASQPLAFRTMTIDEIKALPIADHWKPGNRRTGIGPTEKKPFDSREEAQAFADASNWPQGDVYRCSVCDKWHLSKPRRK